jgi:hypothetical protein
MVSDHYVSFVWSIVPLILRNTVCHLARRTAIKRFARSNLSFFFLAERGWRQHRVQKKLTLGKNLVAVTAGRWLPEA